MRCSHPMHRAVGKLPSYVYSCCAPPELMPRHSRTIAMAATRAPRQAALVSRAASLLPYAAVPVARGFSSGERGGGEAVKGMVVSAEAAAAAIDDATWASPRQMPAGRLAASDDDYIPQIALHERDGRRRRRVLVLCTGGTLTMAPDPKRNGSLAPVEGALTAWMGAMRELQQPEMPEVVLHEYSPLLDSSDMSPSDWGLLASDIRANYFDFDGFVVLMGTDTMAYAASALSFMLENLGKPVIFTGSQIPLCEAYNDARRNLIMALIFASRDTICEVCIFFHDRLLRGCRSTKVNTTRLMAFDSPNIAPLAQIGITIEENHHLLMPPARGPMRAHMKMDTRMLTVRLVPGFDDSVIQYAVEAADVSHLRALVVQLYGTGNLPSAKQGFLQLLADANDKGILVVAATQCLTGSVMMGHYAVGQALSGAGVVSASDMTVEAVSCKLAYLFGRGDLNKEQISKLLTVSLRGELTPEELMPPTPFQTPFQIGARKAAHRAANRLL